MNSTAMPAGVAHRPRRRVDDRHPTAHPPPNATPNAAAPHRATLSATPNVALPDPCPTAKVRDVLKLAAAVPSSPDAAFP